MTLRTTAPQKSLAHTLTVRLVLVTIASMVLQATLVAWREYLNETDFLDSYIRREALKLASFPSYPNTGLNKSDGRWRPRQYNGPTASAYAFRIFDDKGNIHAAHNIELFQSIAAWTDLPSQRQDWWVHKFDETKRMHVVGGLKVRNNDMNVWIELATRGDPSHTYLWTIAADILDDILVPSLPLAVLGLLVTLTTVRRSFRPLADAANRADTMAVKELADRFDTSELPSEASQFASAINRLLDRLSVMISTQRLFIARAAHELRTPLSIMMLELGHLKDPRGKQLERDVEAMVRIVEQLLLLARMEAAPRSTLKPIEVTSIVRDVVGRMQAWAEKDGHRLSIVTGGDALISGDETSVREATRNLVENAVKHTPAGTTINVEVARDGAIIVEDGGPGFGNLEPEELQLPFRKGSTTTDGAGLGLAIVHQTALLHGGALEIATSPLGGARFKIKFPVYRPNLATAA